MFTQHPNLHLSLLVFSKLFKEKKNPSLPSKLVLNHQTAQKPNTREALGVGWQLSIKDQDLGDLPWNRCSLIGLSMMQKMNYYIYRDFPDKHCIY